MESTEMRRQNVQDEILAQPKINQIASQLAKNKRLDNLTTALLSAKTESMDSVSNGKSMLTDGPLHIKIEKVESMQPATAAALDLKPVSASSTINQIASQLANSKSQQTSDLDLTKPLVVTSTKEFKTTTVVGKMSEALSLKQSPTLTKQLATPISGSVNKMQVITQYMCRYCGQQFDSPTLMQTHIQDHVQGKAPHQCSVCGKEYRTPSKLQRHVRVHSGERPYACSICGRRFTRSDHVKQHMKVHSQSEAKEGKDKMKLLSIKPKDQNICHLCNGMKFNRRQALHLHLQQHHVIHQVFTCHRCGEAYESLEEMQSHKLTHDSILNSMKDSSDSTGSAQGVAKFALGPQKSEEMNKFDIIKPEANPMDNLKNDGLLGVNSNGFYVPANLDNVSALSNKLLLEGMEKMAKEAAEFEVQKKYQAELERLSADAKMYQAVKKKELEEQAKIVQCFTIRSGESTDKNDEDVKPMEDDGDETSNGGLAQKTMVSADGMSMFILPTSTEGSVGSEDQDMSDLEKEEEEESEQNSSKESVGINREGVTDKADGETEEKMDETDDISKSNDSEKMESHKNTKEDGISVTKTGNKVNTYTKPCPKSKKPGYIAPKPALDIKIVTSQEADFSRPMVSCINPKINELIKAKVGQTNTPGQTNSAAQSLINVSKTISIANVGQILSNPPTPKLAFIPNSTPTMSLGSQPFLLPIISGVTSLANTATALTPKLENYPKGAVPDTSKMLRCEHCCMWFEDTAMCLLHNTLHSADEADPFTCRKCYKKLGNRLEFMAHLVWHLEPNMDI